ncbi:MAG: hypothetical protein KBA28_14040 [Syntrophaceae bacterium]|jgi:hypothetical protein|nr:hypothetical protein [Syntrophaceae bacterium]HQM44256.1 hypothetical protein [Smithellaceae bacterium]HQM44266.1 hypothetical protein [Smithellaceae bacterium]
MKNLSKKKKAVVILASVMALTLGSFSAFASEGTLPTNESVRLMPAMSLSGKSVADIESDFVKPVKIVKLSNSLEERYYKSSNTMDMMYVILFKDGKAVGTAIAN